MSKTEQKGIKAFTKNNPEVLTGTIIVIGSFVIVEICTEFIMAIIWAINVEDSIVDLIVFAAAIVYYGPGIVSLYKIGIKYYLYYKTDNIDGTKENIKHDFFSNALSGLEPIFFMSYYIPFSLHSYLLSVLIQLEF